MKTMIAAILSLWPVVLLAQIGFYPGMGIGPGQIISTNMTVADTSWPTNAFVTEWLVPANFTVTLPTPTGTGISYNYHIHWGDGSEEDVTTANKTHTYVNAGTYTNIITGTMNKWYGIGQDTRSNITRWLQCGDTGIKQFNDAFRDCANLVSIPSDISGLYRCSDFRRSFLSCASLTGAVPVLGVLTNAVTMDGIFSDCIKLAGAMPSINTLVNLTNLHLAFTSTLLSGPLPTFSNCTALVTIADAFAYCSNLVGEIPSFNACTNLNSIAATFRNTRMTSSIPDFSALWRLTNMHGTFVLSCVTGAIPDLRALTNMYDAQSVFNSCPGLTGQLPDISTWSNSINNLNYAFNGCPGLSNNTRTVAQMFGTGNFTNLGTAYQCFEASYGVLKGNAADFTNKTFRASFTISSTPGSSSYRMFFDQTNLTDWASLSDAWK